MLPPFYLDMENLDEILILGAQRLGINKQKCMIDLPKRTSRICKGNVMAIVGTCDGHALDRRGS
jgi:hypothetical protein